MACRECLSGALHEGTPTGRVETIHGLPTYISDPTSGGTSEGIIVIIPDAFGYDFKNNRILGDSLAKRTNSRVYLPDFMGGNVLSTNVFASMDKITGNGWKIGKMLLKHFIAEYRTKH